MTDEPKDPWRDWLEAEGDERADDGDARFAELARAWRRVELPPGLTARIEDAVGLRPPVWRALWFRCCLGSALASTGLALAALTPAAWWGLWLEGVQIVASAAHHVLVLTQAWLGTVFEIGAIGARVGAALGSAIVEPGPAVFLLVNVLIAAGALEALRRLMAQRGV
jgi:hypothetical protein